MKSRNKGACVTRLPNYAFSTIIVRFTIVSLVGVIIMQLIVHSSDLKTLGRPNFFDYLRVILSFNLLSEMHIVLDNILEYFLPIPEKLRRRFAIQIPMNIGLIIVVFQFMNIISPHDIEAPKSVLYMGSALGLVFVTIISSGHLLMRLMEKWVYAQQRIDEMKQEKLQMDYNALQDQLNPHFLFNNLSVLKSLIIYNKNAAVNFTENFTDVYRYVLKSKDKMLVEFRHERKFMDSYIGLHKERIGEGLNVIFSIEKEVLDKEIAPLTLQLLVENAIKHNVASKESPLTIEIKTQNGFLIVENTLQLKEASYSTLTGLKNLINRYQIISEIPVEVKMENEKFIVKIPLL